MEMAWILFQQVAVMFVLVAIGFALYKTGKVTGEGSRCMGNLLVFLSLPCVIVNGFLVERTPERVAGLAISTVAALAVLGVSTLISYFAFRGRGIEQCAAAYSNPGFFGIPLIAAALGADAVFYIAPFIGVLNLLQWTYGVTVISGQKGRLRLKTLLTAPFLLAILAGMTLFLTRLSLPVLVAKPISYLAGINTPLAMVVLGVYLAQTDRKKLFGTAAVYAVSAMRLAVIPLVSLALLSLLPAGWNQLKLAVLIAIACPVGSNVAVYAQLHHKDYAYAVAAVTNSTLFSIVSIPLLVLLANRVW